MEEVIDQLITVGAGLCILAGAWFIWLLSGVANNLFAAKKWSWKRMLEDIVKTLVMGIGILSWVVLMNVLDWYTNKLGMDISALLDGATVVGLLAVIVGGSANYAMKAYRNFAGFIGTDHVAKVVAEQDYAGVSRDVKDFIDTIRAKTSKEDILEDKSAPKELENDVEISEEDAGKGGITNTYPDSPKRYRSAPKDSLMDPSTCYNRECVSYCAWKIFELTGKWPNRTGGMSAKYWIQRLAENGYTKVVDKPQNGGRYVGVSTAGEYGHVLWYEEGEIISEYNYVISGGFSVRAIDLSAYKWVEIKAPVNPAPITVASAVPNGKPSKKDGGISYTYKNGDTFGQVITDLGLKTSHGLWGEDGDIAYYNNQLHAQGIWGNIPVGTTIKLTPRK